MEGGLAIGVSYVLNSCHSDIGFEGIEHSHHQLSISSAPCIDRLLFQNRTTQDLDVVRNRVMDCEH